MIPREWIRPTERELTPAQIKMLPDGAIVTMIGSDRHGECYREELVVIHCGKKKYLSTMTRYYGERRLIDIKNYNNRRFTVRKEPEKMKEIITFLIIYNHGEKLEFGECANCGQEEEPSFRQMYDNDTGDWIVTYPSVCRKCRARFTNWVRAEDVV